MTQVEVSPWLRTRFNAFAERSSSATKQIEALVKTIQADTNEAVISMEQTTTEVVRGARLAQDAGVSLEEIESIQSAFAALIPEYFQRCTSAKRLRRVIFPAR